jgi:hypothetical protein
MTIDCKAEMGLRSSPQNAALARGSSLTNWIAMELEIADQRAHPVILEGDLRTFIIINEPGTQWNRIVSSTRLAECRVQFVKP